MTNSTPHDTRPKAVLVDIDGTLANTQPVRTLLGAPPGHSLPDGRDTLDKFHALAEHADTNPTVIRLVHMYAANGYQIVIATARSERYRTSTTTWLNKANLPNHTLHMRPDGDPRPDHEVKADILDRLAPEYRITHALEDHPDVTRMLQERGIHVTVIPG